MTDKIKESPFRMEHGRKVYDMRTITDCQRRPDRKGLTADCADDADVGATGGRPNDRQAGAGSTNEE